VRGASVKMMVRVLVAASLLGAVPFAAALVPRSIEL
jgi:hypothetical protein